MVTPSSILKMRALVVLIICGVLCDAALPPGYEDEIYCPPKYCLRPKPPTTMVIVYVNYSCGSLLNIVHRSLLLLYALQVGGKSVFFECYSKVVGDPNIGSSNRRKEILTWGAKRGQFEKDALLEKQYHQQKCEPFVAAQASPLGSLPDDYVKEVGKSPDAHGEL
jgi:hypothetical protein